MKISRYFRIYKFMYAEHDEFDNWCATHPEWWRAYVEVKICYLDFP